MQLIPLKLSPLKHDTGPRHVYVNPVHVAAVEERGSGSIVFVHGVSIPYQIDTPGKDVMIQLNAELAKTTAQ